MKPWGMMRRFGQSKAFRVLRSFLRASVAYDLHGDTLAANEPITEEVLFSPHALVPLSAAATPYTDGSTLWDYATVVSTLKSFASAHSTAVVYEDLTAITGGTALTSGREMAALRINDDGTRPILFVQTGVHGNELDPLLGVSEFVRLVCESTDPLYVWLRDNVAIFWLALGNPDGTASSTRNNANSVNLNRNWDWFWQNTPDADKGTSAASETETQNLVNWLSAARLARGKLFIDWHTWNSSTDYGFLTDHIYWNGPEGRHLHRACYHYANHAMRLRDWSGFTVTNGTANMRLVDRKSSMKSYPTYWSQIRMADDAFGFVCEVPETESVGVNATAALDIMRGVGHALRDHLLPRKTGILAAPAVAATDILNNNSSLNSWITLENRPGWMTYSGLQLERTPDGLVEMTRPGIDALGVPFAYAASTFVDSGTAETSFVVWAGGKRDGNTPATTTVTLEYMEPATTGGYGEPIQTVAAIDIASLPVALQEFALCHDGTYVYAVAGHTGSAYSAAIYRIPIATIETAGWSLWKTLSKGIQRHTAHVWGGKLLIIGGRDSSAYLNTVIEVDLSSGTESAFGTFTGARGWHTSVVLDDHLFIVGGWGGATARSDVLRMDLTTKTVTTMAPLPGPRRSGHLAVRPDATTGTRFWHLGGQDTAGNYSDTIFYYDVAADDWVGLLSGSGYTYADGGEGDEVTVTPVPLKRAFGSAAYDPYKDVVKLYGGLDDAGAQTATVFMLDPDSRVVSNRGADDFTWGYVRGSQVFNISPGEAVTLTAVAQNGQTGPLAKSAYLRPSLYVGPLSSYTPFRHAYTVPPSAEPMTFSNTLELWSDHYASAQQVRAYARHYGSGTRLLLKRFQVVKKPFVGVSVPEAGKDADVVSYTFTRPLEGGVIRAVRGVLLPKWGSQLDGTVDVIVFDVQGPSLTSLILRWVGSHNVGTDLAPHLTVAGKFQLVYTISGVTSAVDLADEWEINHDRFAKFLRHDAVHFALACADDSDDLTLTLAFYGDVKTAVVPTGKVVGMTCSGSGVTVYAEEAPEP